MSEEMLKKYLSAMRVIDFNKEGFVCAKEAITRVLDLIEKQQKQIDKLKNQNKLASEEHEKRFNKFEAELEKKDKIIDEMASCIDINGLDIDCSSLCIHENCEEECIKEYFEKKMEEITNEM